MALGTGCMQTNFKNVATFEYLHSTCLKLLNKVSAQTFDMEQANIVTPHTCTWCSASCAVILGKLLLDVGGMV